MKHLLRAIAVVLLVGALTSASATDYVLTDLGSLEWYPDIEAQGMNNSGQVVGGAYTTNYDYYHAFLYTKGALQDLGTLGGSWSWGNGINNSGQVVGGSFTKGDSEYHPFLYSKDGMQDLTPKGKSGEALGINNSGQVVGISGDHAFLYTKGALQDLGTLGGSWSWGNKINDFGQVVGVSYTTGDSEYHPFLYSKDGMQDLTPKGKSGEALGINNSGQVVGISGDHAFLYINGVMQDLGTLDGGGASAAYGINNSGQVVGSSDGHAFLYDGRSMLDLNALSIAGLGDWGILNAAFDINDAGQICGFGFRADGSEHSFLLTPVPEPTTMLLLGSGLVGLAGFSRKFRKD